MESAFSAPFYSPFRRAPFFDVLGYMVPLAHNVSPENEIFSSDSRNSGINCFAPQKGQL
jgi:hypothetical protein